MEEKKRLVLILFLSFFAVGFSKIVGNKVGDFFVDSGSFISSVFKNPKQMGAALPSTPFLAKKITKYIRGSKRQGTKILEVGAGTGVFTQELARLLKKDDVLDVVEIDSDLCILLREKFCGYKNIKIHNVSILDWNPEYKYDYIVSGLPFNAFEISFVKKILYKYQRFIKDTGIISYFEYAVVPSVTKFLMTVFFMNERKEKYVEILNETKCFRSSFKVYKKELVLRNFPPAYVHFMKKQSFL